jgi:hypothetical protein
MKDTANLRRITAAGGLVLAAVLSVVWTALQPPFPAGYADRLAAVDRAGTSAAVSAALFVVSQLPMLAAVFGIGQLARSRAPVAANLGVGLSVLGVFGHAVFGGVSLVTVVMAGDVGNREVYGQLLAQVESSPVMAFAALGLVGTVLGTLVLSIALWRSRVVGRWVPALLWAFLLLEFVGSGLGDYAGYAGGICYLIAFGMLAARVWQSARDGWASTLTTTPAAAATPA